jgi:hypothetical protein
MVPDCIDPNVGGFLREIMKKSIPENVADCWSAYDFGDLWEARMHWSGCPACRPEFAGVPPVFKSIGVGLENRCRDVLSYFRDNYLREKNAILAAAKDLPTAYAEIITLWAEADEDVYPFLAHGQEALSLRMPTASPEEPETSPRAWWPNSSTYREFFRLLEFDVQCFVSAAASSHDLLMPVREKMDSEYAETGRLRVTTEAFEDLRQRMQTAIANCGLRPDVLWETIELAAIANSILLGDRLKGTDVATVAQTESPQKTLTTQETKALQGVLQEWKQDFDNFEDSVKAGQMELVRLIERNSRSAAANEPYIAAQLGEPLYSRLHEKTRRALQLAVYLYNINQEPDGFSLTAITMAQGYENELIVRIIGPFVIELLAAGTKTYNAQGKATRPLIVGGRYPKDNVTLGNLGWYLKYDQTMRSEVSALGFDVEIISRDVALVSALRNKPAHDFSCDRAVADDLRRRILGPDGILSRLHPKVATAADALTA